MNQILAFMKKEWMESIRTGKLLIMVIIFSLFGIMNPAMALLTPWLFDMLSESMAEQGLIITEMTVDALTSWGQYYKNISMMLIVLVVMFAGILVGELQKGTLINILTKGLPRWKVISSKSLVALLIWTICYWLSYGITYGYNAYYWDNSVASYLFFAAFSIYLLGIWLISLIFLGSVLFSSSSGVLLFTGGVFAIVYFLSMVPKVAEFLPTKLLASYELLQGIVKPADYAKSIAILIVCSIVCYIITILRFNKKRL